LIGTIKVGGKLQEKCGGVDFTKYPTLNPVRSLQQLFFTKCHEINNFDSFGHQDKVSSVAISADGQTIVSGSYYDDTVKM
jgi:WD40 repeat protein